MATLNRLFTKAVTRFLDPDRETRISFLVRTLNRHLSVKGTKFSLADALAGIAYSAMDLKVASERVYREALERGWSDGELTANEQAIARWMKSTLSIEDEKAREIELAFARLHFGIALTKALDDGILSPSEEAELAKIAGATGCSTPQFMRYFFRNEGEAFLRSVFLKCIEDGVVSPHEWHYLVNLTATFGMSHQEMLTIIAPHAHSLVERVLADAKIDGHISPHEDAQLGWMLANLGLEASFVAYVRSEISMVKFLEQISMGNLPSIPPPTGFERRSGEIVHWFGGVTWVEKRHNHGVERSTSHLGTLAMYDSRLVFSAPTKSHSISYRKILSHEGWTNWIHVQRENKPLDAYKISEPSPIPYSTLQTAIAGANQTRIVSVGDRASATRHIPRDVRQRVWQTYGGKCAECQATDYLEFDHIIPHSRGGSNTDQNIQLLCRRCNLKKSDHI